jgi:hypothetical protein
MPRLFSLTAPLLSALALVGCQGPADHTRQPDLAQTLFQDADATDRLLWIEKIPDGNEWNAFSIPDLETRRTFLMRRLLGNTELPTGAKKVRCANVEVLGELIRVESSSAALCDQRLAVLYPYQDATSVDIDRYCDGTTAFRTALLDSR